jgi:uncharacterized protein affecting Mg2+/Co2+ transport
LFSGPWAVANGSYLGLIESGQTVVTRIPEFRMEVPTNFR